jgi:hypothetical protein
MRADNFPTAFAAEANPTQNTNAALALRAMTRVAPHGGNMSPAHMGNKWLRAAPSRADCGWLLGRSPVL